MAQLRLFPRFAGSLFLRIVICVLVGTLLLSAVYLLPVAPMEKNLEKSAATFAEEGIYPSLYSWCTSQLDSTTDALILMISAYGSDKSPFVQAMEGMHHTISSEPVSSSALAVHYGNDVPFDGEETYYQYWHGYQLITRPLLSIMDYTGMRIANGLFQFVLLLALCLTLYKTGYPQYIFSLILSIFMLMPVALVLSLQFSPCYCISMIGTIAVLRSHRMLERKDGILFLYIGIATAFLDFLTYPIATLGIPAVVYFCIQNFTSVRNTFCRGVKICFSWGLGYIGMWAGKWIMGSLITGTNILDLASSELIHRSSLNVDADDSFLFNAYVSLSINIKSFIFTPVFLIFAAYLVILTVIAVIGLKKRAYSLSQAAQVIFPFFVLACLPVIWYLGTANHSTIHHWFTNKALIVSVFAAAASLIKLKELRNP